MKYDEIVAAWDAQHVNNGPLVGDGRMWDAITDRERIEFVLSLSGKDEKQDQSIPKFNCWSSDDGDTWFEHPADAQLLQDVGAEKVGDEFEVSAGWSCVTARYRVIKAPDDLNDDFEVECISHREENQPAATIEKQGPVACPHCDGTGDVHSLDGEWRGECDCGAAQYNMIDRFLRGNLCDENYAEYSAALDKVATQQPCPSCEVNEAIGAGNTELIEMLQAERDELAAQVTHWKANHAAVVEQARILKERPDMPIERVKAYENWAAMAALVEKMRESLKEMVGDFTVRSQLGAEIYKRAVSALALPDLSTSILNRVRAEALRKAADIFESQAIGSANMSSIRALAADMGAGKCQVY